jgi:ribonucleotide reductase alpha subunit
MDVVSQGGVRRGAFAAYLDIDHGDIEEFFPLKISEVQSRIYLQEFVFQITGCRI